MIIYLTFEDQWARQALELCHIKWLGSVEFTSNFSEILNF